MKYETRKEHEDIPKAILEAKETIICMKDESEKNIAATRNESPQLWNLRIIIFLLGRVTLSNSVVF